MTDDDLLEVEIEGDGGAEGADGPGIGVTAAVMTTIPSLFRIIDSFHTQTHVCPMTGTDVRRFLGCDWTAYFG
jgi:hypothetical protein